jgi:threonylcarbamoyladenosine tRNA methylthiotransferase MtaB
LLIAVDHRFSNQQSAICNLIHLMKYSVITFGCRVNQADSLAFEEELRAAGATTAQPETADLVVVNTCSVTATADQGARQTIRRVARDNPGARIVVTGCYATRRPDEVAMLPNVLRVVANDDKARLLPILRTLPGGVRPDLTDPGGVRQPSDPTTANRFGSGDGPCGSSIEPGVAGRTAFTLRLQTGCAEPCAYCIIPATRGAPRSVPSDYVIHEIDRVSASGFKEIALTGVHLGSYGRDLTPRSSLVELFERIHGRYSRAHSRESRPDDVLFRISSLEPMDCSSSIVHLVSESDVFAPHFHLPLQHASDRVLDAMRRAYTIEQYASLVDDIRARMPDASIGSDVIVGFPGETDADVDRLAAYLERSPLTHVHVFPYSDRPGTVAAAMSDKVPGGVVRERARRIRDLGQRLAARFRDSQVGTVHRGLTLEDGSLVVTDNYLKVRVPPGSARNEWVHVRLTSHHDGELLGS